MKLLAKVELALPRAPNFLRVINSFANPDQMIDIADLSDDDLRQLGKLWIDQLVAHAKKRRALRPKGESK